MSRLNWELWRSEDEGTTAIDYYRSSFSICCDEFIIIKIDFWIDHKFTARGMPEIEMTYASSAEDDRVSDKVNYSSVDEAKENAEIILKHIISDTLNRLKEF